MEVYFQTIPSLQLACKIFLSLLLCSCLPDDDDDDDDDGDGEQH